jgi:hypothetical protein
MIDVSQQTQPCLAWAVSLVFTLHPALGLARHDSAIPRATQHQAAADQDGQHDFDFEFGVWKTHLSRLLHPLTGSTTWVTYQGQLHRPASLEWPRKSRGAGG